MQNMESDDKRVFARFSVKMPVKFIDLISNTEGQGESQDISAKGIGLTTKEEIRPLTPLEMWLKIPNHSDPVYTRGEAVWSEMIGPETFRTGVNLSKADLMGISRIMRSLRTV